MNTIDNFLCIPPHPAGTTNGPHSMVVSWNPARGPLCSSLLRTPRACILSMWNSVVTSPQAPCTELVCVHHICCHCNVGFPVVPIAVCKQHSCSGVCTPPCPCTCVTSLVPCAAPLQNKVYIRMCFPRSAGVHARICLLGILPPHQNLLVAVLSFSCLSPASTKEPQPLPLSSSPAATSPSCGAPTTAIAIHWLHQSLCVNIGSNICSQCVEEIHTVLEHAHGGVEVPGAMQFGASYMNVLLHPTALYVCMSVENTCVHVCTSGHVGLS